MDGEQVKQRSLKETPTWAVAVVFFIMIVISIIIEHLLHMLGKWLNNRHKKALYEALEKVKAELMLLGFISLLLTVLQDPISDICVSESVANSWLPCPRKPVKYSNDKESRRRKLLWFLDSGTVSTRRSLGSIYIDKCAEEGKVAFVSAYAIHQLHYFIFVLAVFHVIYCVVTLALGRTKMTKWEVWEIETKTIEYQYHNDPERFRFARETSFGRRHLSLWSKSSISLWTVCFFRQFFGSVTKTDYLTLRHGFIMAHLSPESETKFDFQKYITRSLEEDFQVVVGITPILWAIAMLFLLTNTYGWYSYFWFPFIPLIIILLVGAKLQVIITKLGLRIQEGSDVVKGAPVVKPGDELFWFGRPRFILFLIHLVLFQNAFQLAFFIYTTYEFKLKSCFHKETEDVVIRITMGVLIQILCSYVTLPLYALVTQMGSTMKPTVFNDKVAAALKNWRHTAKEHTKHSRHSESGMSPVHLLHSHPNRSSDSCFNSPRNSNFDSHHHQHEQWDSENQLRSPRRHHHEINESPPPHYAELGEQEMVVHHQEPGQMQIVQEPPGHEFIRSQEEFSFGK